MPAETEHEREEQQRAAAASQRALAAVLAAHLKKGPSST